jgi:hypothetical protein
MDQPTPTNTFTPAQLAWIEALESNTFLQGRLALQTMEGGYCCLGVACAVLASELNLRIVRVEGTDTFFNEETNLLPLVLSDKLHLFSVKGETPLSGEFQSLIRLNDDFQWTLPQIGVHLRQYPWAYLHQLYPTISRGQG